MGGNDYQEKIIELIMGINNENVLKLIYNLIISMKKKWGV